MSLVNDNEDPPDSLGPDHAAHWTTDPRTGERVEEASMIINGVRTYWCGHTEPE